MEESFGKQEMDFGNLEGGGYFGMWRSHFGLMEQEYLDN